VQSRFITRAWRATRGTNVDGRSPWAVPLTEWATPIRVAASVPFLIVCFMWQPRHSVGKLPMLLFLCEVGGDSRMKKTVAAATFSLALMSSAMAQERTGDAALGALSGAVVLGPVGAVAGAIVGYTAGPSIASAWGLRRSSYPRRPPGPGPNASYRSPAPTREAYAAMPAAPPPAPTSGSTLPPVQPLE